MNASINPLRLAATVIIARDGNDGLEVLMLQRPARGSFPSAWVFPGGKVDPEDGDAHRNEQGAARIAAAREVFEETQLRVTPASLVAQAIWSPPAEVKPRFRTWFFVAPTFCGTPVAAEAEAVALTWVRPAEMLTRHAAEEITLVAPTWVTLNFLSSCATLAEVLDSLTGCAPEEFPTRHRDGDIFCWPGDALYDDPAGTGESRHRLESASLPWRYVRS